jgi:hypothetical protein
LRDCDLRLANRADVERPFHWPRAAGFGIGANWQLSEVDRSWRQRIQEDSA